MCSGKRGARRTHAEQIVTQALHDVIVDNQSHLHRNARAGFHPRELRELKFSNGHLSVNGNRCAKGFDAFNLVHGLGGEV